jgi:hypothetical protein
MSFSHTLLEELRLPSGITMPGERTKPDFWISSGIYVVTVRAATGEQVIYVDEAGLIVQAPVTTTTVQKSAGTVLPAFESSQTVVTYDQVQQNVSRYQLLEKKGTKEVYRDNRTGQKLTVRLENN